MAVPRNALRKRPSRRRAWSILLGAVGCCALSATGCRSHAYEDVYRQELLSEIRVLEDQLYEADYENEKLAAKLERARQRAARCERAGEPIDDEAVDPPQDLFQPPEPPSDIEEIPQPDEPDWPDLDDELRVDPGLPFDPEEPLDAEQLDGDDLLPAPGGPQPPGEQDLRIPPIEEGEPVPPPQPGEVDDGPPGKIELDDALSVLGRAEGAKSVPKPKTLRLQPGFSGGHQLDDDDAVDGLLLVVSVIDDTGREVDLSHYEIAADLSIVALDPQREASDAQLAQWQFTADQLQQHVASRPVHGLHLPVAWQEKLPLGDQVAVHLRLQAGEKQLRCEATLPLKKPAAVAEWTPRGKTPQRSR